VTEARLGLHPVKPEPRAAHSSNSGVLLGSATPARDEPAPRDVIARLVWAFVTSDPDQGSGVMRLLCQVPPNVPGLGPWVMQSLHFSWSPPRVHVGQVEGARSVNDARGRIAGDVSDQVTTGHRGSTHRQIRLTHTNVTGRPAAGRSRTHVARRSCNRACTPQPRQKTSRLVVSTACSSSPFCCDTASRTNPSNPSIAVAALTSSCTWGLPRLDE